MTVIGGEHGVEEVSRGTASSTGGRVRTRTASRDKTTTRRSDTRHRHKTRKVRQSRRHTPSALMVDPHHASILRPSAPGPETRRRISQHLRLPGRQIFPDCDARSLKSFRGIKNLPPVPIAAKSNNNGTTPLTAVWCWSRLRSHDAVAATQLLSGHLQA
ncbi:hypothetical protein J6590_093419 [Homalodisca vitripennis]|nr:hypothetical protein J6590_093419 [Homalodisca vitripennis]